MVGKVPGPKRYVPVRGVKGKASKHFIFESQRRKEPVSDFAPSREFSILKRKFDKGPAAFELWKQLGISQRALIGMRSEIPTDRKKHAKWDTMYKAMRKQVRGVIDQYFTTFVLTATAWGNLTPEMKKEIAAFKKSLLQKSR